MTEEDYIKLIGDASQPLEPQDAGVAAQLALIPNIRAVLLDVYGTMLISASGDIGPDDPAVRGTAVIEALASVGIELQGNPAEAGREFRRQIDACHAAQRDLGIDYPEVEIRDIWRATCRSLGQRGELLRLGSGVDYDRLAIEFEVRVNPVWAMPGLVDCLKRLRELGTVLGIVSNAQFFTPLALQALTDRSVDQLGFDSELRYYSYEFGRAKPGAWLYEQAAASLERRGVLARETLYIGNDMRNDVWPAGEAGFRTALFAGDRRSLRLREDDPRSGEAGPIPDAVITRLGQVPCLLGAEETC
jgi:putative hydrolase of the HAD superfamily